MTKPNSRYLPFDKIIIGYCNLMIIIILVCGRPLGQYLNELLTYVIAAVIAFLIPNLIDEKRGRFSAFLRLMYAALLFAVFYRTAGGTMFLIFDRFFDDQLVAFETA